VASLRMDRSKAIPTILWTTAMGFAKGPADPAILTQTGKSVVRLAFSFCPASSEKIFCFSEMQITAIFASVPSHQKGRIMIVANAGRDAVAAWSATDESAHVRTEKACGPGTPTLVSSWREVALMTVAKRPGAPAIECTHLIRSSQSGRRKT
jgi:hypothetical protein